MRWNSCPGCEDAWREPDHLARAKQIVEERRAACAHDAAQDAYSREQRADAGSRADELRYILEAISRGE
jgi:hypothetical protein